MAPLEVILHHSPLGLTPISAQTPQQPRCDQWQVIFQGPMAQPPVHQERRILECLELCAVPPGLRLGGATCHRVPATAAQGLLRGTLQCCIQARQVSVITERLTGDQSRKFDRAEDGYERYKDAMAWGRDGRLSNVTPSRTNPNPCSPGVDFQATVTHRGVSGSLLRGNQQS